MSDNTTHKFSHCDCNEPVSLDPASKVTHEGNLDENIKQPEWRELGPNEVIQEGDEFKSYNRDWRPVHSWAIGKNPSYFILHIFRTRRTSKQNTELKAEVARLKELVEWYKSGMESCWHVANTYDGNYVKACDNVMHIASERLLVKEELKAEIK